MNLHGIVRSVVAVVNPEVVATLHRANGYTVAADGTQVPSYKDTVLLVQMQSLSSDELRRVEGLNIQGNKTAVYLPGRWNGIIRIGRAGGDMITIQGKKYLVATVLENWPDWTKLLVVLQNE